MSVTGHHALPLVSDTAHTPLLMSNRETPSNRDAFGRTIDYLRLSITDRCNLRCVYCMPAEGVTLQPRDELLRPDELLRVAKVARSLGFTKFRVTGGEPTVHKDFAAILLGLRAVIGNAALALTTNAVHLAEHLPTLEAARLDRLNISLDTLDPERFKSLTRRDELGTVLDALDLALAKPFLRVKVNAVIVPGHNEQDLVSLASLAETRDITVRFIEAMPLDGHEDRGFLGADVMRARIHERYPLTALTPDDPRDAAQLMFSSPALKGRIGFIAPRSQKFCAQCNRLRLTPNGELKGCLLKTGTFDLRTELRRGIDDHELAAFLAHAIFNKPREYQDERYGLDRSMSGIGG